MFKQTVRLFLKALIIGVLVNMGLQQVSGGAPLPDQHNTPQYEHQILRQLPADTELGLSNQTGN